MAASSDILGFLQQAANTYGTNPNVLSGIARRESGYSTGADPNLWDSNAKAGHPSTGMFQFIPSTFQEYASRAESANPAAFQGIGPVNTGNWKAQALAASYAIAHGGGGNWSTYQAALKDAGQPVRSSGSGLGLGNPSSGASLGLTGTVGVQSGSAQALATIAGQIGQSNPELSQALSLLSIEKSQAGAAPTAASPSLGLGSSGFNPASIKGVKTFDGKPVAAWIVPELQYAQQHGWKGTVTSGYRTLAQQAALQGHSGGNPVAAPGTSNHELTAYPGGAIDASNAQQLGQILQNSPYAGKLVWAGGVDPVHLSHPHNGSY